MPSLRTPRHPARLLLPEPPPAPSGIDAHLLLGVPLSTDLPAESQVLTYVDGKARWQPPSAGGIAPPSSPARGDLLRYDGSAWVLLPPGTAGQVLQTGGAGADPSWVAPGGGGSSGPSRPSVAVALYAWRMEGLTAGVWPQDGTGGAADLTPGAAVQVPGRDVGEVFSVAGSMPFFPGQAGTSWWGVNDDTGIASSAVLAAPGDLTRATFECLVRPCGSSSWAAPLAALVDHVAGDHRTLQLNYEAGGISGSAVWGGYERNFGGRAPAYTSSLNNLQLLFVALRWDGRYLDFWINGQIVHRWDSNGVLAPNTALYWGTNTQLVCGGYVAGGGGQAPLSTKWVAYHASAFTDLQMRQRCATALGWPAP